MFTLKITYRPLYIIALYRHRYFTQKLFMRIKKYVQCQKYESFENNGTKMGCIFPMVNSSEFRMRQYRDDDHREDAPHFNIIPILRLKLWNTPIEVFLYQSLIFES